MNIEKTTIKFFGWVILVLSIIFGLAALSVTDYSPYIASVIGIILATIIVLEGGFITYFTKSEYKKVTTRDILVWFSMLIAGAIYINSILLLPKVGAQITLRFPQVASYLGKYSAIIGALAALLSIFYLLMPSKKN